MRMRIGKDVITESFSSFIRFNEKIGLYELVGTQNISTTVLGEGRTEYIEKQVVIKAASKELCIELDKQMFPKKYF